jgi:hypothetical protein
MRERNPRSVSDPQQILPLAEFSLKAHALGNLEARDDAPLDLAPPLSLGRQKKTVQGSPYRVNRVSLFEPLLEFNHTS